MGELEINYTKVKESLPEKVLLVAVSKTKPKEDIEVIYDLGQRDFGENKIQEMSSKHESLPKDIHWHMIGHVQTNKVKYMAPFVHLVHSVDRLKLLKEINKEALKNDRIINCLLQLRIAEEETKQGLEEVEIIEIIKSHSTQLKNVKIMGLMGMASFTEDKTKIEKEFEKVNFCFTKLKENYFKEDVDFSIKSFGMSGDFSIAIEKGSNMVRVGSAIFGARNSY